VRRKIDGLEKKDTGLSAEAALNQSEYR